VLLDDNHSASNDYAVGGLPQTVVIGKDGLVKNVFVGYGSSSDEKLAKAIDDALK
jgi:hypothetical protein